MASQFAILAALAATASACWPNPPGVAGSADASVDADASMAQTGDDAADSAAGDDAEVAGDTAASEDASGEAAPAAVLSLLRFANWSPDAPAVDVCTAPHGTGSFKGPLVAAVVGADAGGTVGESGSPGLAFPLVSSYFLLDPGVYDVRFVAAGSATCSTPVLPDVTTPTLARGTGTSMALVGEAGQGGASASAGGLGVITFADEIRDQAGAPLRLRFINASPALGVAQLGTGSFLTMSFVPLFPAVAFGQVGGAVEADAAVPGVDDSGYCRVRNLSGTVLSVGVAGTTTDSLSTTPVSTLAGIPVTIVAVGGNQGGAPLSLLECLDSAGTVAPLSGCAVLP